jgi:hypothetical protein
VLHVIAGNEARIRKHLDDNGQASSRSGSSAVGGTGGVREGNRQAEILGKEPEASRRIIGVDADVIDVH